MVARSSYRTGYEPEVSVGRSARRSARRPYEPETNMGSIKDAPSDHKKHSFIMFFILIVVALVTYSILSEVYTTEVADTADAKAFNDLDKVNLDKVKVIEFKKPKEEKPKEISEAQYNSIYNWIVLDKWYAKTVKPMLDNDGIIDEDELLLIDQAWDYECIIRKEKRIDVLREKLNTEIEKQLNKDDIIKGN